MASETIDRRHFTWLEFVDTAKRNGPCASATGANHDRFAHASFNETLDMAYGSGWIPESPNVADLLKHVETDLGESMIPGFDWYFDTSGMEVDIPRYLAGEPENMIQALPMKVMRTGRVIRLYVPNTYPSHADVNQIIGRGIAIMALVEAFSMMQHPTEIVGGICNEDDRSRIRTAYMVTIQSATEPLDMGRIMLALAHPATARQLGWSVKETCPQARAMGFYAGGGWGSASREIIPEDYEGEADENVIVLPSIDNDRFDWTSEAKVVAWIRSQLERIQEGSN